MMDGWVRGVRPVGVGAFSSAPGADGGRVPVRGRLWRAARYQVLLASADQEGGFLGDAPQAQRASDEKMCCPIR